MINAAFQRSPQTLAVIEAQIRLAWTLHQGPNVLAIPGAGDIGHLEDNVAAADIHFTQEEPDALDT